VRARLGEYGAYRLHAGAFAERFPAFREPLCFTHADCDLYAGTVETIKLADRLLTPRGRIVFDDYGNPRMPGVRLAADRYLGGSRYAITRILDSIQVVAVRR
jgi:hypothetical protein